MTLLRNQLGQALRNARKSRGLKLREVSALASISISHISEAERGVKEMSSEFLELYLAALRLPLSRLLRDATELALVAENPVPDTPAELAETPTPAPSTPLPMSPEWFKLREAESRARTR
jgi:transcriptional regulator with XRE-family HTH domain